MVSSSQVALREEGRKEGREELVIVMLRNGASVKTIADYTSLSLPYIQQVQEKMEDND